MSSLGKNIRKLIVLQGLDTALMSLDVIVEDLGLEASLDEFEVAILDEISYSIEDAE